MRILFLDVDGVLNRESTKEKFCGFTGLDKFLVERFLKWRNSWGPDLDVVLSSSWRIPTAFGDFKQHLRDNGIFWISETPRLGERGFEIRTWLNEHPKVISYAILDDCVVRGHGLRHVQTSEKYGVRDRDLARVNRILSNETSY